MCRQVWLVAGLYDPAMLSASIDYSWLNDWEKLAKTLLIYFTLTAMTLASASDEGTIADIPHTSMLCKWA